MNKIVAYTAGFNSGNAYGWANIIRCSGKKKVKNGVLYSSGFELNVFDAHGIDQQLIADLFGILYSLNHFTIHQHDSANICEINTTNSTIVEMLTQPVINELGDSHCLVHKLVATITDQLRHDFVLPIKINHVAISSGNMERVISMARGACRYQHSLLS